MVMEDMLKVVTGEMDKYPYGAKIFVKMPKNPDVPRSISQMALKNKNVQIKNRLTPGEGLSGLQKQRIEERKKLDEQER